jgi:hypothetical protein
LIDQSGRKAKKINMTIPKSSNVFPKASSIRYARLIATVASTGSSCDLRV